MADTGFINRLGEGKLFRIVVDPVVTPLDFLIKNFTHRNAMYAQKRTTICNSCIFTCIAFVHAVLAYVI